MRQRNYRDLGVQVLKGVPGGMADVRRHKPVATAGQGILRGVPKRGLSNQTLPGYPVSLVR